MDKIEAEKELLRLLKSKGYKKISINVTKETLKLIDEYAGMVGITRSTVINSILQSNFSVYLNTIESGINRAISNKTLETKEEKLRFLKFKKDLMAFRKREAV